MTTPTFLSVKIGPNRGKDNVRPSVAPGLGVPEEEIVAEGRRNLKNPCLVFADEAPSS